jgi:aryl-alcohol dehydrogenase-like predicted oxidoreductase
MEAYMETRRLGKTGHMSSILIFGSFALYSVDQKEADAALETALEKGVNHIDVSPIYGEAEIRIGSWIGRNGNKFFLACKTHERSKAGARESLQRSLETLKVDHFDLFQFHGVDDMNTLDTILGPDGALEAVLDARDQGLLSYIGITGHRPATQKEALARFDFDTVLFPLNRIHAAHLRDWNNYLPLLETARQNDVGVMAIKSVAKGTWDESAETARRYNTWYEPFDEASEIQKSLWYTLSQDITSAVMPGDLKLWPMVIDAAERFKPLTEKEQNKIIAQAAQYQPLVGPRMD